MNKTWLTVLGFLLAVFGFLAVVLSIVGLQFSFLAWLDFAGRSLGFLLKVIMMLTGFVMAYLGSTRFNVDEDWQAPKEGESNKMVS